MPAAGAGVTAECLRLCGVHIAEGCSGGAPPESTGLIEPWGWVDGRGSLLVPMRASADAATRVVLCLRHPFEVAVSLRDRHGVPLATGLALWHAHAHAILRGTSPEQRVTVHYAALRDDVRGATRRLAALLDLAPATESIDACVRVWRSERPSATFTAGDLVRCHAPRGIRSLYRRLCVEAGYPDDGEGSSDDGVLRDLALACRADRRRQRRRDLRRSISRLHRDVARLRHDLASRDASLRDLIDSLPRAGSGDTATANASYLQSVHRLRDLVSAHVPRKGIVAVLSKGDDELVKQRSCTAWHFPRDERGDYLGYHPASGLAAVANLETLRARGATHLLVPETHAWWLTSYPAFRHHLDQRARIVETREGIGTLYELVGSSDAASACLGRRVAEALGRPPSVLAWNAPRAAGLFPDAKVFAAEASDELPYIDQSIDVVVVADPSDTMLAEARRVAAMAVVDATTVPVVEWIHQPKAPSHPSVSIVIPVSNQWAVTDTCLRALLPSLPADWLVEVIVVDDASSDETPQRLTSLSRLDHRIRVLRNDTNLGFVGSTNRGAAAATGDFLVFLNNDTVPLPGWLPPLIETFRDRPTAGAVGGKLLFPDGRLQEAGGIIFADGSACHFGREHPDPAWRLFNHVRPVDYVSGALLATPRAVFASLGGFGAEFAPGYYEDTDYCFRLRETGREVVFQPNAVVVHLEGGTAGTDHAVGMKRHQEINRRRFLKRHAAALARQRQRPTVIDEGVWAVLAHAAPTEVAR